MKRNDRDEPEIVVAAVLAAGKIDPPQSQLIPQRDPLTGTAAMRFTVEDLLGQIEQHHLMSTLDLEAVKARWFRPERKAAEDVTAFREWLRANDYLSEFVLTAVTRGQADQLTLNQYRLTDWLRGGPEAGDFLATDPLDRVLRVGIVSPAATHGPAARERFQEVVQKLMSLEHPGVAHVLDFGHARGVDYLVSEHVEGESLEEFLKKRGKVSYELATRVFAVAFDALAALQQHDVPGGELNAGCLVVTPAGKAGGGTHTIRLVNVGLPRSCFDATALGMLDEEGSAASARRAGGEPVHFPTAPQPAEEIGRVGAVFFRCVTGHASYPAGESPRPGQKPLGVRQQAPEVPGMLADLLDNLIDPVPENRPRNAAAVAKSLRVFLRTEEEERHTRAEEKIAVPVRSPVPAEPQQEAAEPDEKLSVEPLAAGSDEPEISTFFRAVMRHEGSDLHLAAGAPPLMRWRNVIRPMDVPALTPEDLERLVEPILNARSRDLLDKTGGADFAYIVGKGEGRFRVNLFKQRGQFGLVARRVNTRIPTFEKLRLPPVMEKLCSYDQGMVIVAGVTGSGKSTTLAAMLDSINEREQVHILTIEDPIEYLFTNKRAVVNQREVGIDVSDWNVALKHAVRQDPDVILVGEMRDRETFEAGLNAAETGHLVFCTIHASTAPSTIGRILDLFPADMHPAIRQSLAFNLKAIVCQKLLPSNRPGVQRVPANEIMIVNSTIRELLIKGEDKKLPDALRIGMIEGMLDFNESLRQLVARGDVTESAALEVSPNPEALKMAFTGIRVMQPGIL
jgi:twitching motility protein PilT